jgi:hypothetical protein
VVAVTAAATVLLTAAGAGAAAAAPAGDETATAATGPVPQVDNTKWPAALNWVIPGTPEFTARYTAGDTAGGESVIAGTGCTAAHGGDAYRYTVDFFTNLGAILDAQATATGHGVMTIGDQPLPTAPWPGLATDRGTAVLTLGSGEKVMATPGALIAMPSSGGALAGGAGVCADTLRAYGTPAADAPFGFGFYNAPDQGSVDFLMAQLAGQQDLPAAVIGENTWTNPAQFYDPATGAENKLRTWDFSPLKFTDYCSDENNPFCLTAAFLRCPSGDGADDAETAAITACRTWNANVIILNQDIAMTLMTPGVGVPVDGDLDPLDAVASPGQQAPLDGWTGLAVGGKTLTQAVKMLYVSLGAAALIGGLVAGGIPGLLIAAGVIGVAGLVLSQGIFGAVSCAQDLPKCMAAAGADGLIKTLALIPAAAGSTQVPDMTGPSMTALLSTLGGISAALVLVFFLISLLAAGLMHRPSQIWPAFFGLVGWGAAMGLGGAFLTMLIAVRSGVMTWLNTDGGAGTVLEGFPASVSQSLTAIAADPKPGLLLAGLLSIIGIVLGVIVWVIVWVSGQWIPLVVALLVLQSAGMAAPGMPRTWLSRGFSVLWTLLLTPVMVLIIWRVGKVGLESNTGYLGLLSGVLVLLACAFSFLIVQRMLPMGEGAGMGIGAAMMSAASWVAGRASSSGRPGPSRQHMAQRHLEHAADPAGGGESGGGSGGGSGGPVPPALPTGTGAPDEGGSTAGHSGSANRANPGAPGSPPANGGVTAAGADAPHSWVDRVAARLTSAAAQEIPGPTDTAPGTVDDTAASPGPGGGQADGGAGSTRATPAVDRPATAAAPTPADPAEQPVSPPAPVDGPPRDHSTSRLADHTRQKAGVT